MVNNIEELSRSCADENKNVILVFANNEYFDVLDNWLRSFYSVSNKKVLIVAMDDIIAKKMTDRNISVILGKIEGKQADRAFLAKVWALRCLLTLQLLKLGFNVIHSDADAVWLKDPFTHIDKMTADIIASPGTIQPPEIHQKWKTVICCGFFQIKSTEATIQLYEDIMKIAQDYINRGEYFGDQPILNKMLLNEAIQTSKNEYYYFNFKNRNVGCSLSPIEITSQYKNLGIKVSILPHRYFPRHFESEKEHFEDISVCHPLSKKNGEITMQRLKECNLIFKKTV